MTEPLVTILDDEPAIRSMLASALNEAGFRTMGFARATEFEASLRTATPDVCLVDLGLPDRDGLTLVHQLALEQGCNRYYYFRSCTGPRSGDWPRTGG